MRVRALSVVFAGLFLAACSFGSRQDPLPDGRGPVEFMSVAELKQLVAGGRSLPARFKTVVEGTEFTEYDITIRDVVNNAGVWMIIFTSESPIVGGMSGSPTYARGMDGRLKKVGAIAYSMTRFMSGLQWGGISPMEYMRAEARSGVGAAQGISPPKSFAYQGMEFAPLAAKLSVRTGFGDFAGKGAAADLREGMPLVVDILEWTDANGVSTTVSATGTITEVGTNGEISGFGHPFLGARTARYNFRTCRIIGTVYSRMGSFKMSGDSSPVLGTIEYDGVYGIYGTIGGVRERPVTEFTMDFSSQGKPTGSYQIRMATSPLTSLIMDMAFAYVGEVAGVPIPRQASTASFSSTVELEGHEPIVFSQVFTSTRLPFGPEIYYASSYENACKKFLQDVYVPLGAMRFGFKITKTRLSFDFAQGLAPELNVASARVAPKLTWGKDAFLDLLLVSKDNTVTLSKRVKLPIDWSQVEKPVYTAETKDTEKEAEKVVNGRVSLYTVDKFNDALTENEKEAENPPYYLDAKDALEQFRNKLARGNRMLFAMARLRKASGSHPKPPAAAAAPTLPAGSAGTDWLLERKRQTERKTTVRYEASVPFSVPLPAVPVGFMVGSTGIYLFFEVVQ